MCVMKIRSVIVLLLFCFSTATWAMSPQAAEYLRKANSQLKSGNLKAAENYYRKAKELAPDDSEIADFDSLLKESILKKVDELQKKAFFLMQEKNLPEAAKIYSEILMYQPENQEAVSQLESIGKVNKEISEYRKQGIVIDSSTGRKYDLNAYSSISYFLRAKAFFSKGDNRKAIEMLDAILEREPDHREALELKEEVEQVIELDSLIERANASFNSGEMENVIRIVNELIARDSGRYQYLLMRARAYIVVKRYSDARHDLWSYWEYTKDKETVFPLLADVYSLEGKYLIANGFAYDMAKQEYIKPNGFILKNYFYGHLWSCLALILCLVVLLPAAIVYMWNNGENLFLKFSLGSLRKVFACSVMVVLGKATACVEDLMSIARDLNFPWLNYFVGLVLLTNGNLESAQKFFKFACSDVSIKARACYFHGLIGRLLGQSFYDLDFEETVLCSFDRLEYESWRPWFMRSLERDLFSLYSANDSESLEYMAYKMVSVD